MGVRLLLIHRWKWGPLFSRVKNSPSPLETADNLHQGAFGLSIPEKNIDEFISRTDSALANMPNESLYYVDYIFNKDTIDPKKIIEISQMEDLWGKDIE